MKSLILLSIVLPFCLTIEVKVTNTYANAIKKVEIPSCKAEPCDLVKGTPTNITITVESRWPHQGEFDSVSELESTVDIGAYRDFFVYNVAPKQLFCKQQPNECPLKLNKVYKINRQLFLSKDTASMEHTAMGSRNGLHNMRVSVIMVTNDINVGTVIGTSVFQINIKAKQ